jgi:predicted AlkP superfamily pyrophosphatase or phosphodiesterase
MIMRSILISYFFLFSIIQGLPAQSLPNTKAARSRQSKLIVGIVVDQMRNDYIYRYWNRYGNAGFKRLIEKGYYFKNAHYNYVPTYTGPGHSTIYTGATPRMHGIIANEWYNKQTGFMQYCVDDDKVTSTGTASRDGKKSPHLQICSTIGDELKISSNGKSKVIGIALKDRSAVLPAGHAADAAYWYDDSTGFFVSSSWYLKALPEWVNLFNAQLLPKQYLLKGWNTLYSPETYTASLQDNNPYEKAPNKKELPVFPYEYTQYVNKNSYAILKATPYGNTITKDMAIACLKNEKLGKDEIPDILAVSFSSPDIISHSYGPRAVEVEDVYLRLDKDIEEFLKVLDTEVGKENYLVFLTADHGGADVPAHLHDEQIPAGYLKAEDVNKQVKVFLQQQYGDSALFLNGSNEQIFLNEKLLSKRESEKLEQQLSNFLTSIPGISEAYPSHVMRNNGFDRRDLRLLIQNGFNHKRSGNVVYTLQPAWMDYAKKGTTHGAAYSYDTHVPLIFYGAGIKSGESYSYTRITQIAPVLAELLKVSKPNGCLDDAPEKLLIKKK